MHHTEASIRSLMTAAFKRVDADQSGFLQRAELQEILRYLTQCLGLEAPSSEDVEDVLREIDQNGDGRLSKEQFQPLIEQVLMILFQEYKVKLEVQKQQEKKDNLK